MKIFKKKKISDLEETIALQKKIRRVNRLKNFVFTMISVIGLFGGVKYVIDINNVLEEYEPKYSSAELHSFAINHLENTIEGTSNVVIRLVTDDNNEIVVDLNFDYLEQKTATTIHMNYIQEHKTFRINNALVLRENDEEIEIEDKEISLTSTKIEASEEKAVNNFLKSYFTAINTGNDIFYDSNISLVPGTEFDVDSIRLLEVSKPSIYEAKVEVKYLVYEIVDGEITEKVKLTQIERMLIRFNLDTKKIESIVYY